MPRHIGRLAQLVEQRLDKAKVTGSNPVSATKLSWAHQQLQIHGAVAQLGERLLCKQRVVGSSPIRSTMNNKSRVLSSVGRAAPLQGVGRRFEPVRTHQQFLKRPGGEIGRHAVLRGQWRKPCGFESRPGHHLLRTAGAVTSLAVVAQLVEHRIENPGVAGSTPALGTIILRPQQPKRLASSVVEHRLDKAMVAGSSPAPGTTTTCFEQSSACYKQIYTEACPSGLRGLPAKQLVPSAPHGFESHRLRQSLDRNLRYNVIIYSRLAQLAEQWSPKPKVGGSSPSSAAITCTFIL